MIETLTETQIDDAQLALDMLDGKPRGMTFHPTASEHPITFVDYVAEFYQDGIGLYADDFQTPVTREDIVAATRELLVSVVEGRRLVPWEGDTVDREAVAAILDARR